MWQGSNILTVSLSGYINYLNQDGDIIKTLKGHTKSITALAIVNDRIFSASHDGLIIGWNAANGDMNSVSGPQHSNKVQSLVVDSASNTLISCGYDDTAKFIDIASMKYM